MVAIIVLPTVSTIILLIMNCICCKGFRRKGDGRRTSYAGEKVELSGKQGRKRPQIRSKWGKRQRERERERERVYERVNDHRYAVSGGKDRERERERERKSV